jgi:hypothetical protein
MTTQQPRGDKTMKKQTTAERLYKQFRLADEGFDSRNYDMTDNNRYAIFGPNSDKEEMLAGMLEEFEAPAWDKAFLVGMAVNEDGEMGEVWGVKVTMRPQE